MSSGAALLGMTTEIFREFTLEIARCLPTLKASHPCARMHGHTLHVQVHIAGEIQAESGWVMDFNELNRSIADIKSVLDHRVLNEIAGLENPTTELLARWIWRQLKAELPGLCRIQIRENPTSGCNYTGEL